MCNKNIEVARRKIQDMMECSQRSEIKLKCINSNLRRNRNKGKTKDSLSYMLIKKFCNITLETELMKMYLNISHKRVMDNNNQQL